MPRRPDATIVVIVPVLSRPHRAAPVAESIRDVERVPTDIVFVCSIDDPDEILACKATGEKVVVVPWAGGERGDYARKINVVAATTEHPFLFTAADDLRFTSGWDEQVLEAAESARPPRLVGVVGTDDHCNPRTRRAHHSTHSLIVRAYVDEHGTIDGDGVYHEQYWHNFCDDELVGTARHRRAYAPSRAVVEHLHPAHGRGPMDDTYRLGMARFAADRATFRERRRLWAGIRR